ncbi:MAG: AgmX/PglI C-terminal domain-containing protein [Deltaproteobacteria bacterium]|nr:AgmX/PglI C-terminal domain-containing protein [Deltaproteobacteria bacterium]
MRGVWLWTLDSGLWTAAAAAAALIACSGNTPPPEAPKPPKTDVETDAPKKGGVPAIEYDLGAVDPSVWKKKVESLKSSWNDCYLAEQKKHPVVEGKLTFTVRTHKDGSVKWAYVKQSDLGSRTVEKCIIDSIKAQNFGPPMDAKEGEVQGHTYGWALDDDDRPADPGAQDSVWPVLEKAKGKLGACRNGSKGKMIATLYIDKGGKPLSAGVAIDDPALDASVDCVVDVLMGLKYVNKASWPTKVSVSCPSRQSSVVSRQPRTRAATTD